MSKLWLSSYPAGMPETVNVTPAASLTHLIDDALKSHAALPAITAMGKSTSFADLDVMSSRFGAWLQSRGVGKGDRVALMMPNVLPFAIGAVGVLRVGGTVVTVNPMYTPRELAHQLKDSGAKAIVIFDAFAPTLDAVLTDVGIQNVVVIQSGMVPSDSYKLPGHVSFVEAMTAGAAMTRQPVEVGLDDVAFLQYTGGTTGVSKGAVLLHRNVLANVIQMDAWVAPAFAGDTKGFNTLSILPMYHIFALTFCLLWGIRNGLNNHLVPNPRDMAASIKGLAGVKLHIFPGVNTLFAGIMAHPDFKNLDLSELRLAVGGGAAVHEAVADRWIAATGVPIVEGYGLSETSPMATCNLATVKSWTGTIGLPVPNTDIAIRDDNNQDVPLGERGEICIRGPQVMAGYWQRPDETANVTTSDGYFKSGDIGVMDERGYVKIVDRKKDMILVSGFNVFPNEIEEVVAKCAGVLEVAAIGVPDDKTGEAVKIFIVKSDPALTEAQVTAHCRTNLTAYKCPKQIVFMDALPKSTVGKVLRRELRA